MSEVLPGVLQASMSEDRRSMLQKQAEIEDDETGDDASAASVCSAVTVTIPALSRGIPPTIPQLSSGGSVSSPDEQAKSNVTASLPNTRSKTLIRGHALEGNSPPPESLISQATTNGDVQDGRLLGSADRNRQQRSSQEAKELLLASRIVSNDSGHGTLDHTDDASDTSVLSRDSSLENAASRDIYKDSSGVDIPSFMRETLLKSPKDRKTVLFLEEQILYFINNDRGHELKMAEMTSYDRMIVHRLAAFLGLDHNIDNTGKCVILNRTEKTRSVKLSEMILSGHAQHEPKRKILLKKPNSFDVVHSRGNNRAHFGSQRAASLEERRQNYLEVRDRIFRYANQCEGDSETKSLLTANGVLHLHNHQQQSQDSTKPGGHQYPKGITDPSPTEPLKDSIDSSALNQQNSSQPQTVITTHSDHQQTHSSAPDAGPPSVTQWQSHPNTDGSLYHFDPTCPPPFIAQPQTQLPPVTPPASHAVYQNDSMADITSRFAAASVGSIDQGSEVFGAQSQPTSLVATVVPHPQAAYPSQVMQGQYLVAPSPSANQQPVRYVAIPFPPVQGHHYLQGPTVDNPLQATIPMPAVGYPAVPTNGGFQVVGAPQQMPMAVVSPPHCVDINSVAFRCGSVPESVVVGGTGGLNVPGNVGGQRAQQQFVLTYAQPQPVQQVLPSHQTQFASPPQGTFYTIPVPTPTPPLSLTQPPPSSHQPEQQHQPALFYSSSIANPLTYAVPISNPSTSASSLKPLPAQFIQTYTSHLPHQQLHPHQPQPLVVSPPNGHHPAQWALNYSQPMSFNPASQEPQYVALQTSAYDVRSLGTAVVQFAGAPMVHTAQLGTGPQLQSYQILRPAGSVSDLRFVNPGTFRPRLSPLHVNANNYQPKSKQTDQYRQLKKGGKKMAHDAEDYQVLQTTTPQQAGHMSITPTPGVTGCVPKVQSHIQCSSYRQ